ncbi:hypothetical protein BH11MYX1_BH11MYX1_10460 [soil metagenome]
MTARTGQAARRRAAEGWQSAGRIVDTGERDPGEFADPTWGSPSLELCCGRSLQASPRKFADAPRGGASPSCELHYGRSLGLAPRIRQCPTWGASPSCEPCYGRPIRLGSGFRDAPTPRWSASARCDCCSGRLLRQRPSNTLTPHVGREPEVRPWLRRSPPSANAPTPHVLGGASLAHVGREPEMRTDRENKEARRVASQIVVTNSRWSSRSSGTCGKHRCEPSACRIRGTAEHRSPGPTRGP